MTPDVEQIVKRTRAFACIECGKCTGCCPVSKYDGSFSPRSLLIRSLRELSPELLKDRSVWSCLTCRLCDQRCPSNIDYIDLTRGIRALAHTVGEEGVCTHGGALQSLMRIMTATTLNQNRLDWLSNDLKTASRGEWLYFVGCAPYFDVFFSDLQVKTLDGAKGAIRILNAMGIEPTVLPNERCCGHDLLWSGDVDHFKQLAEHNVGAIRKSGAQKVVFSCPEGYRTFKLDYPAYLGPLGFEVLHISQLINEKVKAGELSFDDANSRATYQDPCRLGRHMGLFDPPREVMAAIPGLELLEMGKNKNRSVCCGATCWTNCTSYSKLIQINRLQEAKATGAEILITACPKCEIHLRCAMNGADVEEDARIEIRDFTALVAERLRN